MVALIGDCRLDWRLAMDISRAAFREWLDTPNMRGAREIGRLFAGYFGGITIVLSTVALVQAAVMSGVHADSVGIEVLATARILLGPLSKLWALAMSLSAVVAIAAIRFGFARTRPRLASALTKYTLPLAFAALIIVTSPPFARISPFSAAMVIEVALNLWLAGLMVNWAVLGPRRAAFQ